MRQRIVLLSLLLLHSLTAQAVVVSRITDFVPNTKAEADQVDAEFDNIISAVNGNLDSENFRDGGIATADIASAAVTADKIADHTVGMDEILQSAGAYVLNDRHGCLLNGDQTGVDAANGFKVLTPCEVVINGVRASLAATATVSTTRNMDTGAADFATWHYVYIKANTGTPTFFISKTKPDLSTGKKIGDTTSMYLGPVRTAFATDAIVFFKTFGRGNEYRLYNTNVAAYYEPGTNPGMRLNLTTSPVNRYTDVPVTATGIIFQANASGSATGLCKIYLYNGEQITVPIYSTSTSTTLPFSQPVFNGTSFGDRLYLDAYFDASTNCTAVNLTSGGFIEPLSTYQ